MKKLTREEITDKVVVIRINKTYEKGMNETQLYEYTRGFWSLSPAKAKQADYAFAVYQGEILEVYKVDEWYPAGTTEMKTRTFRGNYKTARYEFVGKVAPEDIRSKYVGNSIADLFSFGASNPIRYFL